MSTSIQQKATERMVVLLRPREKLRLQKLARKERVSSAEILRRSLAFYAELDTITQSAEFGKVDAVLDRTLASIRAARDSIQATLADIAEQHSKPEYLATQKRLDEILGATNARQPRKSSPRRKAA